MEKLYKLNYTVKFHNTDSNTESQVTYSIHGITGFSIFSNSIRVEYEKSFPISGMSFDLTGELVKLEMVEE